jgi:shikimate kinase
MRIMTEPKHIIYLAGFMGSGKSTIGPELARRLGYKFVDIDDLIEEAEGISIRDIFKHHGEAYFRGTEKKVLTELARSDRKMVVGLGGGTLTNEESRQVVRKGGVLVYLKASPNKIFERVRKKRNRPMLLSPEGAPLTDAELSARVESLLREREAGYMEASIVVSTSELTVSKSVEEIALKLKGKIL